MRFRFVSLQALVAVAVVLIAGPVGAQYKWQTPDGKTVYSDVPPIGGAARLDRQGAPVRTGATPEKPVELPYALKQAAAQQPVVIYTAADCGPCQTARQHLTRRGIPFSERTINTQADFDALKGLGFSKNSFPGLTIGRERTVGYEPHSWDKLLTAAGYPTESQLPPTYRQAAAEPMTPPPVQKMVVSEQTRTVTSNAARGSNDSQRAIDQYRSQLQNGQLRAPDVPAMRF
jgi:glutaredoxin